MQYRSGANPYEPTNPDTRSRAWLFIYRGASYPTLPEAFLPHTNFVAWLSSPQGSTGRYLIRGYCQWSNPRNYHTLKTRYCKRCEWIPIDYRDRRQFDEYVYNPVPFRAERFYYGVPLGQKRVQKTTPLQVVGLNIQVPDLIEDYQSLLDAADVFAPDVYSAPLPSGVPLNPGYEYITRDTWVPPPRPWYDTVPLISDQEIQDYINKGRRPI